MSYAPYPAYKDSGVPWLGQVPEGWEVKPIKYISTCNDEALSETTDPEMMLNYVDISSVDLVEGIQRIEQIEFEKAPSRARRIVREGDTIISTVRTYLKAIAPVRDPIDNMIVSTGFAVIRPDQMINPDFLGYFIQSDGFLGEVVSKSTGVSYPAINPGDLVAIFGVIPPIEEQNVIADFLDQKTAEIDELIAKKEELLRLLAEQRTALITHAVTKGLNPIAPMKPSGVDWLGDVPEGWDVKRLKYLSTKIIDGAHFTPTYTDEGVPFLRVTDIVKSDGRGIDMKSVKFISEQEHRDLTRRCKPEKGDLLYSKNGTIGVPRTIDWDWEFSIFVSLCLIKLNGQVLPEYLEFALASKLTENQISFGSKATSVTNLHLDKIKEFIVVKPPLSEQEEIVNHLKEKNADFIQAITRVEDGIDYLKEYRTALITNAVTGKIKVHK